MDGNDLARTAARAVKVAQKQWRPATKQSRTFLKTVVPAAVKPLHVLWHEVISFVFLALAVLGIWKVWRAPHPMPPIKLGLLIVFIVVMTGYGVSSWRKSRRISRS